MSTTTIKAPVGRSGFSPVIVTRTAPPVGDFECDHPGCRYPLGTGPRALLWHARTYGHTRFTDCEQR